MTTTVNLSAAFAPALTEQPWMTKVVAQLASMTRPCVGLVGVDIGHVCCPDDHLIFSEPCAGFVRRGTGIEPVCAAFRPTERRKFDRVCRAVTHNTLPARTVHGTLQAGRPQMNTLVFREFTLFYSFDLWAPHAGRTASLQAGLILHDAAREHDVRLLSDTMQVCLHSFTAAHDDMGLVALNAPGAYDLEQIIAATTTA